MVINEDFDNIIIGSGGAGLTTAILLAQNSKKVAVVSKTQAALSHTSAAQGGINANFGNVEPDDWKWHAYDTIKGSDWIADYDAVEVLCSNANKAVNFLSAIGVNFDKDLNGNILQKKYGGQTTNYGKGSLAYRACSVGDRTGAAIINSLYKKAIDLGVKFIEHHLVFDLIIKKNRCIGAIAYDIKKGMIKVFASNNIVVATGGFTQIFAENTASRTVTGDGLYLVSKNGIALKDMEFVQFHPTAMFGTGILISETARSIGGLLINSKHQRFMDKYAPIYMELATRDIVSRAIDSEIEFQKNILNENQGYVWLDLRHVSDETINSKLGYVGTACKKFLKIDVKRDLIPVRPAAHYTMGGIPTNINCQVLAHDEKYDMITSGLYAVGEAACLSVHGANRLGCNSLLDIIVFGMQCADHIISSQTKREKIDVNYIAQKLKFKESDIGPTNDFKKEIQEICSRMLGITKSNKTIKTAIKLLEELSMKIPELHWPSQPWDLNFIEKFEAKTMLCCALHLAYASLNRLESRGSHFRSDYIKRDDINFLAHSYTQIGDVGKRVFFKEIRRKAIKLDYFEPEIRKY